MNRPLPTLDGLEPVPAASFARRRVLTWRQTCRGSRGPQRFSVVRCADVGDGEHLAEDAGWWTGQEATGSPDLQGRRLDVALRLLSAQHGAPVVAVWARPGPNELLQSDHGWSAALRHAAADRDVRTPSLLVVTRWGWRCLPEGTSRTWKRPRATT